MFGFGGVKARAEGALDCDRIENPYPPVPRSANDKLSGTMTASDSG